MNSITVSPLREGPGGVESIISTEELLRRPSRAADFASENRVLQRLASTMAAAPQLVLQELIDSARELCRAGSAGISLLDPDLNGVAAQFRWVATSGDFARYAGNPMPRDFSPCGTVLDFNCMLMMTDPGRHFPYIEALSQPVCEMLLVPFYRGREPIGTVWVAQHTPDRHFDSEDARVVTSLSKFAAAAVQILTTAESIRQSEVRHRAMIEASPECVKIVAADGSLLQMNAAGLLMLDVADETAVKGHSVFDFIAPDDEARYRMFHERICSGESGTLTFEIIGVRGVRRIMESSAVALSSANGGFDALSISRDVTERRRAAAALALELKDMRRLRDVAARMIGGDDPSALYDEIVVASMEITNADGGTIQLLDPASNTLRFLVTRGFTSEMTDHFACVDAASESPCGMALSRGDRVFLHFAANAPLGSSDQIHFDYGIRCAQSTPLLSRSGQPVGLFSTHWRVNRTLSEREIRFLDLLGRQAADLIERSQAQEALREADRRKDEFLAILAHELRNPLVPIRTGVELLSRATTQPALIEKIRPMMERQVTHVVRLIDDLLDISRITSGKIELQREQVTLTSVVHTAVEANRGAITAAGLEFEIHLEEPERLIEVDPTRFSQVIANILHNATKFTPKGGTVTLNAFIQTNSPVPDLILRITDTGVGIAPELIPTIFGLFTQVHADSSNRFGGLGIGLALSQKLVELHGGSISAASGGPGLGCQFTVRIPAPDVRTASTSAPALATSVSHGPRVLVVDDNRDAADSTGLLVSNLGGDVRVVYDGANALELLQTFDAAVMLLDIGMPVMDGYQLCRRIRELKGTSVSIVAITGWGQEDDRRRALEAGFDTHLTKPVGPAALATIVKAAATRYN